MAGTIYWKEEDVQMYVRDWEGKLTAVQLRNNEERACLRENGHNIELLPTTFTAADMETGEEKPNKLGKNCCIIL